MDDVNKVVSTLPFTEYQQCRDYSTDVSSRLAEVLPYIEALHDYSDYRPDKMTSQRLSIVQNLRESLQPANVHTAAAPIVFF